MLTLLPSVETTCSMIQQEESQREVLNLGKSEIESSAIFSKSHDSAVTYRRNDEKCLECGNKGHPRTRC